MHYDGFGGGGWAEVQGNNYYGSKGLRGFQCTYRNTCILYMVYSHVDDCQAVAVQ